MEDFRVIIAGCRDFQNYDMLKERCGYYLKDKIQTHNVIIVSGHSAGADLLGERFAQENNLQVEIHRADWKTHRKAAGPIRNEEMAATAQALIAFWDNSSCGTRSMIDIARKHNIPVRVVDFKRLEFMAKVKDFVDSMAAEGIELELIKDN